MEPSQCLGGKEGFIVFLSLERGCSVILVFEFFRCVFSCVFSAELSGLSRILEMVHKWQHLSAIFSYPSSFIYSDRQIFTSPGNLIYSWTVCVTLNHFCT